jgi:hypothetical protein
MEQQLATEATPVTTAVLETAAGNERMRHVPSIEWIIWKLDQDVRARLGKLMASLSGLSSDDARRAPVETELRSVCKAIDRLAEAAKHTRGNGIPSELSNRIQWSLDHAVANLKNVDPTTFGRRYPFHLFEKSRSEPLYGALLAVLSAIDRAIPVARAADASLDERLMAGLVVLANPVDDRMLKPIA